MKDKAQDALDSVSQGIEGAAGTVAKQGREARDAVEKSVKDQPMTTLAAAVAIGFVIGAIWKS